MCPLVWTETLTSESYVGVVCVMCVVNGQADSRRSLTPFTATPSSMSWMSWAKRGVKRSVSSCMGATLSSSLYSSSRAVTAVSRTLASCVKEHTSCCSSQTRLGRVQPPGYGIARTGCCRMMNLPQHCNAYYMLEYANHKQCHVADRSMEAVTTFDKLTLSHMLVD